ncbi:MAG TPA: PEGA domain-containing protein [Myxococcaceae bacterium]|nr:PEGA domain-containing protein [Myxococcaceae bacterium]
MRQARRFLEMVLLLASTGAVAADAGRTSVIAVGKCDEASAISARSFRSALASKPGMQVASESETAQPFGGTTERTLSAVTGSIASARSDFYGGQPAQAVTTLQGALEDVVRLPPSDARWAAERDALTLLAQVRQKADPKAAEAALNRVFRVEPDYQPDTSNYPPSFQKWVNGIRKAAKKKSTSRLDITTSPAGKAVYLGGRKVGVGPVSVRVPPGEYRVEADWGHRGAVRSVTVPSTPVELSAAVEGAVLPDGGPCVEASEPVAALARAARLTGGGRILGVHPESAGTDSFVVVTSANAQGQDVREARVKMQPGASTTEALGLLADWAAAGGEAAPPVEVTRGPGAKPLPVAPAVVAGAAAAGAAGAAAASPAATAAPAPAASGEPDPNATHFEAALRVGIGVPLGSAYQTTGGTDVSLGDWSSFTIPVQLDVGVRLGGSWFLGAYFSYGFAGSSTVSFPTFTCGAGDISCSPSTLRFGGQVHWHPLGNASTDPWIGIGSGYEKVSVGVNDPTGSGSLDVSGWEFANLQVGIDFALGSAVKIGPWVSFSVGQYGSAGASGGGGGASVDIANKTIHEWLMGGVRLVILP